MSRKRNRADILAEDMSKRITHPLNQYEIAEYIGQTQPNIFKIEAKLSRIVRKLSGIQSNDILSPLNTADGN